jgi:predicted ester cyclase
MSVEQNKAIVSRVYEELVNQENKRVIDEVFAPDAIIHDPFMGMVTGRDGFRQLLGFFDAAFPGHRVQVHQMIAEGDWVSVVHTHTAKHTGQFMHLAPTGKEITVKGLEAMRLVNGQIVEFYRHDDDAGLLMQLGAIPAPAQG